MTDGQIAYTIAKMKEYGIVDSGEALRQGHRLHDRRARRRASTTRWCDAGVVKAGIDLTKAYTTEYRLQGRRHGPREVG